MGYRLVKYHVALVRDSAELKDGEQRIGSTDDVIKACADMRMLDREQLRVYFLDARNKLIGWEIISVGSLTASIAHPIKVLQAKVCDLEVA